MVEIKYDALDEFQAQLRLQGKWPSTEYTEFTKKARDHDKQGINTNGIIWVVPWSWVKAPRDPYFDVGSENDLFNGKRLLLDVDLSRPKAELMETINRHLEFYGQFVKKIKTKKATTIDPWMVYDLRHYEGLSWSEIARRISGESGATAYNPELAKVHKKVMRAYNRAKKVMKYVEERQQQFSEDFESGRTTL